MGVFRQFEDFHKFLKTACQNISQTQRSWSLKRIFVLLSIQEYAQQLNVFLNFLTTHTHKNKPKLLTNRMKQLIGQN